MKRQKTKKITVYHCDICGVEEDKTYLQKCSRCNRECCYDCCECLDFDPIGEVGYIDERYFCKDCMCNANTLQSQIKHLFTEFLNTKDKLIEDFLK